MSATSWYNLNFYEYIVIDRMDGQRIYLEEGEELLMAVDSVNVRNNKEDLTIYPACQILRVVCKRREK